MRWNDKSEIYEQKYARVARAIDSAKGDKIILVGESAGGAMALLAFSRNLTVVDSIVTICGYNQGASDIAPYRRHHNPALYPLLKSVDQIVPLLTARQRQLITTIVSSKDRTVTPEHSVIDKAQKVVLHTPGHMMTIVRVLAKGLKAFNL
jgi:pimeloyl-ACP methyl ester carboxylesterase